MHRYTRYVTQCRRYYEVNEDTMWNTDEITGHEHICIRVSAFVSPSCPLNPTCPLRSPNRIPFALQPAL